MVVDDREMPAFGIKDLLDKAQDAISVSRVFGEPYEKDGAMVIPVAAVRGGGGGGGGGGHDDAGSSGEGEGGGFGMTARPVGAYVVKGGEATWKPAWDITRLLVWADIVVIAVVFTRWRVLKARAKHGG